jgi:hypothetical protein
MINANNYYKLIWIASRIFFFSLKPNRDEDFSTDGKPKLSISVARVSRFAEGLTTPATIDIV